MYLFIVFGIILFFFLTYIIFDNYRIKTRKVNIELEKTNELNEVKEYKILHISDFHNKSWRKDNSYLLDKIKEMKPEYVFMSGDIIDRRRTKEDIVFKFIDDLNEIISNKDKNNPKIFYVYGNHERSMPYEFLKKYEKALKLKNVYVMKDEVKQIYLNGQKINIIGMDDISEKIKNIREDNNCVKDSIWSYIFKNKENIEKNLELLKEKTELIFKENKENLDNGFNILLSHRPEGFPLYKEYKIDLVLAGHAHGGFARIPFTDISLITPHQGLFPKYTKGPYIENNTVMYVNVGLGNSIIPLRIFATAELIEINIKV